ncbi:hypothetical protein BH23ACT12_BH23ACT12_12210 [soil metagenome]
MSPTGRSSTSRASSSGGAHKKARASGKSPARSSSDAKSTDQDKPDRSEGLSLKRERTPFEWALLLISLAVIGTIIVGLFLYAGHKAGGEAELSVEVADTGEMFEGGPQVEVTVRNTGGSGAEQVVTEVTMGEQTREVTMARIPKDDEASAVVTFPAGTTGTPEGELLSYNTP